MNKFYQVNAFNLANKRVTDTKKVEIKDINKLNAYILDKDVSFECEFKYSLVKKYPVINVKIVGILNLECQRTLDLFAYNIDVDSVVVVVKDDRFLKYFPIDVEPFISESDYIDVRNIVKEEILLALPLVPMQEA